MKKSARWILYFCLGLCLIAGGLVTSAWLSPVRDSRRFGVTYMTMNNPFYEVVNTEIARVVRESGDELIVRDPELDLDRQIEQIYDFIAMEVDGIFVNPIDSQKIGPALQAARAAGIRIISVDVPAESESVHANVVSDNRQAGELCALSVRERFEEANILVLCHSAVDSARERVEGFEELLEGKKDYRIVERIECEGQVEIAMPLVEKALQSHPEIDIIFCLNDPSAVGALAAMEKTGREDLAVYAVDGTPELKTFIQEGKYDIRTVAQFPIRMGQEAARQMYLALEDAGSCQDQTLRVEMISPANISKYDTQGWQ